MEKMTSGLDAMEDTAMVDTWQDGLDLLDELERYGTRTGLCF